MSGASLLTFGFARSVDSDITLHHVVVTLTRIATLLLTTTERAERSFSGQPAEEACVTFLTWINAL